MAKFTSWNPPKVKPQAAKFISGAEYSANVHEGGDPRPDGTRTPARRFIDAAVAETPIEEEIVENFDGDVNEAFEAGARLLHQNIKGMILDKRWEWDRLTRRKNSEVAGTLRDIVDTGELYRSQSLEFE